MTRAHLLESLGMDAEARLEYDRLAVDAEGSMARLLATGEAFVQRGLASRAIRLGHRAVASGGGDERAYRLIYPVTRQPLIAGSARSNKLDPAMVAALIRQESYFDPRATSRVGARGLMQVMPRVGRELANAREFPFWDDALLYQPDVNIVLGTNHLARLMGRYDQTVHALAAYNAGESRVARWRRKRGAGDLDVFVERIPFDETRDYVRILERNAAMYRVLYEWDAAEAVVPQGP